MDHLKCSEARCVSLGEQLPDFPVNVAQEVHIGGAAMQAFVLHQELTEQHLQFVSLPHDLQLSRMREMLKVCNL